MRLTGRFNFRRTFTGKLVLQLEEEVKAHWPISRTSPTRRRWRDANVMDLTKPELRTLVDLRNRPHFVTQAFVPAEAPAPVLPDALDGFPAAPATDGASRTDGRISKH